jgi:hypothetical protein
MAEPVAEPTAAAALALPAPVTPARLVAPPSPLETRLDSRAEPELSTAAMTAEPAVRVLVVVVVTETARPFQQKEEKEAMGLNGVTPMVAVVVVLAQVMLVLM